MDKFVVGRNLVRGIYYYTLTNSRSFFEGCISLSELRGIHCYTNIDIA